MPTPDLPRKFGPLTVLLLPAALVKAVAVMVGGGPAGATAAGTGTGDAALPPPPPAVIGLPPDQRSAVARIGELHALAFGPSPMFVHTSPLADDPDPDPIVEVIQPLQIVVRGIMRTRDESFALIDGYLYRAGQRLRDHEAWTIERIEASSGTVVFVNDESGQMQIVSVRSEPEGGGG